MLRSETADAPERLAAALRGLRVYQQAPRGEAAAPPPEIARVGRACLRDYGGSGRPILFVPSLINPPDVLDLDAERSLLRWLATRGVRPLLLDWGAPAADETDLDISGHVERLLLPLIAAIGEPPVLAGYCLGGTMAVAAAQLAPVRALALIATPWHFGHYPAEDRIALAELWREAGPVTDALGLLPMDLLQAAFWRLDPGRTVAKFERLGMDPPTEEALRAFVRLEDWANDGPPLTRGAARDLFEGFYATDLPGSGQWRVGGATIEADRLDMPVLEIASTTDRIVPHASAVGIGTRLDLALGHVGMIVGGRARSHLWEPLAAWLSDLPGS
ncbi:alpha/beta hydrolase [Sphingomonas nostoxanthinifaciens]|uniref:alpha/beta hydrolase n=1 Tax=Sphingomonas nostoxanthinifaciens TaxID=2872652 RepID=UPI001CC1CFFD|nr:alpha/beta hydrolase [Sphingomonas nostoxanthinifaciens]UAK23425.1 alpha/beta hydrolase [Sphingomonas nostoxanthinifaciens]